MLKAITFKIGEIPQVEDIIELYESSGINRPTTNKDRIGKMFSNSNLIISAWDDNRLIGIARGMTDFCYACYLSDLAVRKDYQKEGIGKKLIEKIQLEIGDETALILLSAPLAMDYYPKIGFKRVQNGFMIARKR